MFVEKRQGALEVYRPEKVQACIETSFRETGTDIELDKLAAITTDVTIKVYRKTKDGAHVPVEKIQEFVEETLMDKGYYKVAKAYIAYSLSRARVRSEKEDKGKLLSDAFISKYKHLESPMEQLGNFVYYRTYSRWIEEEGRREYWYETVRRAVEYNCSLAETSVEEAELLYDNIFNLRQFLSGRTFWVGGTDVAKQHPMSNFNCAFEVIDEFESFADLFYCLMIGSGVGIRILPEDVDKLPKIRTDFTLINKFFTPVDKTARVDNTSLVFDTNDVLRIKVGDSKEGWVQALAAYLKVLYSFDFVSVKTVVVDYDNVRPSGERLKTFGGTASGYQALENMFTKINHVIHERGDGKLRPIDCLDISNIIGENVVVGGVRRTAEIVLIDESDTESVTAKEDLYTYDGATWTPNKEISHRSMSNNSIFYRAKPTRPQLEWQIEKMRYSGEPGWVNAVQADQRRPNFKGTNPCCEILLDSKGMCNLTTINVLAFVNERGILDTSGLLEAQRLSARAGYRMTCVNFELLKWDAVQKRDRLLGCSLTGWQDMVNAAGYTVAQQRTLLRELRKEAHKAGNGYAEELGLPKPLLTTTVKPEGTLSQLPTVSSGVHYSHSPFYIRRVRISAGDPLVSVCKDLGWSVKNEVGQTDADCSTKVIEFAVKAPKGRTKYEVSALEQLENYKLFMEEYVDHTCSITVSVRDEEWDDVTDWVWDNWDITVGVSFLSLDDSFYDLLPYESIDEETYNAINSKMRPFAASLLSKYEKKETTLDIGTEGCESGACPVR